MSRGVHIFSIVQYPTVNKSSFAFITLLGLFFILSCKSDEQILSPANPKDTVVTGVIIGDVGSCLFDTFGGSTIGPLEGVKISIDSTTYSTLSDASGKFYLPAPTGRNYTLVFTKEGYGAHKVFNVSIAAPGAIILPIKVLLAQVPTYSFVNFSTITSGEVGKRMTTVFAQKKLLLPENRDGFNAVIMFYPERSLGSTPLPIGPNLATLVHSKDSTGDDMYSMKILHNNLKAYYHLDSGQVLYMTLRVANCTIIPTAEGAGTYYDKYNKRSVYTAAGPESESVKITLE